MLPRWTDRFECDKSGKELTTIQPPLALPFSVRNAGSQAGALAGLDDVVEFALADWDGHAGVTVGVLGFADLRRDVFVLGGGRWFVSFEPIEHYRRRDGVGCQRVITRREQVVERVASVMVVETNVMGSCAQV
jgi:hypothetical protein